jgi:hypothetical protein
LTAILVWPYLWFDTGNRILEVVSYFTSVGKGYALWFNGYIYPVGIGVPVWWFPWATFLIVTPVFYLFLWLVGSIQALFSYRRNATYTVLLIWFFVPLVRSFFPNAAFYDGIRHFMEVIPPGILLGSLAVEKLYTEKKTRLVGYMIMTIALGFNIWVVASLFPYGAGYINSIANDPNSLYDRDIEALVVREGMEYINTKYPPIKVWIPIAAHLSWYYARFPQQFVTAPGDAGAILLINKSSHVPREKLESFAGSAFTLAHTIQRGSSVFGWIYRRK